jgi:GNAT superfamily N-acetyltransferase
MSLGKKENSTPLTIRCLDFNIVLTKPELLSVLRKLTLYPYSGMNHELNSLECLSRIRPVKSQVLLAYYEQKLAGWALLSRETSTYGFHKASFKNGDGVLFEVFVEDEYRRKGIGTELIQVARRKANGDRLCVSPWNSTSDMFYDKFKNYKYKIL